MLRQEGACACVPWIAPLRRGGRGIPSCARALAAAVLLAAVTASGQSQSTIQTMVDSVSEDNLRREVHALEWAGGHRSRVNFTPGNDSAAAYLSRAFNAIPGLTSVASDTFYISSATGGFSTKPLVNIEATLGDPETSSSVFVVGAHFDCSGSRMGSTIWSTQWRTMVAPGADDNASGVAAILEMARILSDPQYGFEPGISVKFVAFGAEESGPAYSGSHHGSMHFVGDATSAGTTISGMVSIDMVGYNATYLYQSVITNPASAWLANRFTAASGYAPGLIVGTANNAAATYSDHNSFWLSGIPAVCLMENAPPWSSTQYYEANPFYHTSWDTSGTVNFNLVRRVTQLALAAVAIYAGQSTGVPGVQSTVIPASFVLENNFPNPFNPTTVVRYRLPVASSVEIIVYDVLGRRVRTLVNGVQRPGEHEVEFDARPGGGQGAGLASGVYLCRMEARNGGTKFSATRKMLLMQ